MRKTYVEIDLIKINDNINKIVEVSKKQVMAILKANAYGHGVVEVAKYLLENNPNVVMFGVATLEEALFLHQEVLVKSSKEIPILVLGVTAIDDVTPAFIKKIHLTVYSLKYAKVLAKKKLDQELLVHIKVDTGMNRLGIKNKEELEEVIDSLKTNDKIKIIGMYTHYATADSDLTIYHNQYQQFEKLSDKYEIKYLHASNSAASLYQDSITNLVRLGIAIYGYNYSFTKLKLQPAMSFYTTIADIKKITKDEHVGYGFDYKANKDTTIAILPIGYADGLIRKNSGRKVFVNNKYYPIIGRICMDQTMIEIDDTIKIGDKVEIFGENISIDKMAEELETISYEILCLISNRVLRVYKS